MTQADEVSPASLPSPRECPFSPPEFHSTCRRSGQPQRGLNWDGRRPWLITKHEQVRKVLGDSRFSARVSDPAFPNTSATQAEIEGELFARQDGDQHMSVRRILTPDFTVNRAEALRARISELTDEVLDAMADKPRPLDLIEHFAVPIPTVVICEILGVDLSDSQVVTRAAELETDLAASPEDKLAAVHALTELLSGIAAEKQRKPDDRLLSRLVNEHVGSGQLTFEQAVRLSQVVIFAGHDTTSNMLSLSTLILLREPEQRRLLVSDPENHAEACAEEMLRYWAIVQNEPRRFAVEDVEVGDTLIRAGEGIVCSLSAANRDPEAFTAPERPDITRGSRRQLAFGYGPHQCLGQNLARVELQVALPRLFQRLPDLRLAASEEDLRFRENHVVYGLDELPVSW